MRKPLIDVKYFKARRDRLKKVCPDDAAFVLYSGTAPVRSNDAHYKFRVNSNFFYLTGFEEEHAVLIYRPGKNPETTVFVHPKDPLMETWEGFLFGENEAKKVFGFDEAYSIKDFEQKAAELIAEVDTVIYRAGLNKAQDDEVFSILNTVLRKKGRKGHPFQNLKDPDQYIAPLRVVKTEEEVELMKKASEISALAHIEVMKAIKPGLSEGYLEGVFLSEIRKRGAKSEAYNSIAASGDNATTLHYVFNDEDCNDGELFLIDAGAEYKYYAGDITRTYPVGQDFTKTQRDLYERILEVQKDLIAMVKPGMTFQKLNRTCEEKLTQIMIDFDLLSGTVEENISNKNSKKYYPHGVGHFLGIDVHDVGYYEKNNEPVPFEAGMCLTIEPGIYVPKKDTDAPESLRGVGIRIEDDILVTDSGNEVMTSAVPKEIDEILKLRSL